MFRTPVAELPHPHHEPEADADARFASIVRRLADIGRRNDELRRQIAKNRKNLDRLIAEGDRTSNDPKQAHPAGLSVG